MSETIGVIAAILIVPLLLMLCWNGGLSNVIDGVHNMNYIQAALTSLLPVTLWGIGGARA